MLPLWPRSINKTIRLLILLLIGLITACIDAVNDTEPKYGNKDLPDTVVPTVLSLSPAIDELYVVPSAIIRISFSEAMDRSTITPENIRLYKIPPSGAAILVAPAIDGFNYETANRSLQYQPIQLLDYSANYRIEIFADSVNNLGVKDIAGNVLDANQSEFYSWTFTIKDDLPAAIKAVLPRDTSIDVEPRTDIRVILDPDFLPSNADINPGILSISLQDGTPVPGGFNYDETSYTVTYTPMPNLPFAANVNIDFNLSSTDSIPIAMYTGVFAVREGRIESNKATKIDDYSTGIRIVAQKGPDAKQVVVDPLGNITVVWRGGGVYHNLWVSRYDIKTGWQKNTLERSAGTKISGPNRVDIREVRMVVDQMGNVTVVWQQWNGTVMDLFAIRYDIEAGWQKNGDGDIAPIKIETIDEFSVGDFSLVVDSNGNVTVVFLQSGGPWMNRYYVGYNRWNSQSEGDSSAVQIGGNSANLWGSVILLVDHLGNITAIWGQYTTGSVRSLYANYYLKVSALSGRWTGYRRLDVPITGQGSVDSNWPISTVIDSSGNVTVAWQQFQIDDVNGNHYNIWANRYTVGSGWQAGGSVQLDNTNDNAAGGVKLVVDGSENVTAVWAQNLDNGQTTGKWANRYVVPTGWIKDVDGVIEGQRIDAKGRGEFADPPLFSDEQGNVTVIWSYLGGELRTTRYDVNTGWREDINGVPAGVTINDAYTRDTVAVGDKQGNITVVWRRPGEIQTSVNDLYYNRYENIAKSWITDIDGVLVATKIEQSSGDVTNNAMTVDPFGNVMVFWAQENGIDIYNNLKANRFDVRTQSWWKNDLNQIDGKIIDLSDQQLIYFNEYEGEPTVVADQFGNITVFWRQTYPYDFWSNRFD